MKVFSNIKQTQLNEATVEDRLVHEALKALGFDYSQYGFLQGLHKSHQDYDLLTSKKGTGEKGAPELLYYLNTTDVLVVEVKPTIQQHGDVNKSKKATAISDVKMYMKSLSRRYNVIGLAVSGQTKQQLRVTTLILKQGESLITDLGINKYLRPEEYVNEITKSWQSSTDLGEIQGTIDSLQDFLRGAMHLGVQDKPILIGGALIGLADESFRKTYRAIKEHQRIVSALMDAIKAKLGELTVPEDKIKTMTANFMVVFNEEKVGENLKQLLDIIERKIFIKSAIAGNFDILGHFYKEFLKYSGGDEQNLGIVLTPQHVTGLFCKIANISEHSVVLDTCTGTASFLIASLDHIETKTKSQTTINRVKAKQLIGVESSGKMFTLACANMILRGDGKSNLFPEDLFKLRTVTKNRLAELKPTVALINPPYGEQSSDRHELAFVYETLNLLEANSICVAILPTSCISDGTEVAKQWKEKILADHEVVATMSMPDQLFYPVGAITSILVTRARAKTGKVWMASWKNDGYTVKKKRRIDDADQWKDIEKGWLEMYEQKAVIRGISVLKPVGAGDDWSAEAYTDTNWELFRAEDLADKICDLAVTKFKFRRLHEKPIMPQVKRFGELSLESIFWIERGGGESMGALLKRKGTTPVLAASMFNNSYRHFADIEPSYSGGVVTVVSDGEGVGTSFYQPLPFYVSSNVQVLTPKFSMTEGVGVYLAAIISLAADKFTYGFKFNGDRVGKLKIRVPLTESDKIDVEAIKGIVNSVSCYAAELDIDENQIAEQLKYINRESNADWGIVDGLIMSMSFDCVLDSNRIHEMMRHPKAFGGLKQPNRNVIAKYCLDSESPLTLEGYYPGVAGLVDGKLVRGRAVECAQQTE